MDEARRLLDSLMGNSRDQSLMEAKQNKGKNFTGDGVCKNFLLGFCPLSELAASKMLVKRNISDCYKTHSEAMKAEYENHEERGKYQAEYERELLPLLENLVREADAWVARERANVKNTELTVPEQQTVNNMPPSVKEQYEQLNEDMNKMMAAAEDIAEKGDIEGSKFKVMLAGEIKSKIKELEEKYIVTYNVTHRGEEVCEVCGTRTEAATSNNHARYSAHFSGKVHLAYQKIRDWIKTLREKQRTAEGRSRGSRGGDREGERDRPKRPEKEEQPQQGHRDANQDRGRRRSRSRGRREREGDRDRARRRSRSRERRSRSRDRRR